MEMDSFHCFTFSLRRDCVWCSLGCSVRILILVCMCVCAFFFFFSLAFGAVFVREGGFVLIGSCWILGGFWLLFGRWSWSVFLKCSDFFL